MAIGNVNTLGGQHQEYSPVTCNALWFGTRVPAFQSTGRWRQQANEKWWYLSTVLHGII